MAISGYTFDVRFAGISDEDLLSFVQVQENVNTKKTDSNMSLFRDFLQEVRHVEETFKTSTQLSWIYMWLASL